MNFGRFGFAWFIGYIHKYKLRLCCMNIDWCFRVVVEVLRASPQSPVEILWIRVRGWMKPSAQRNPLGADEIKGRCEDTNEPWPFLSVIWPWYRIAASESGASVRSIWWCMAVSWEARVLLHQCSILVLRKTKREFIFISDNTTRLKTYCCHFH